MKKITSIKTRITIWYTAVMLILMLVVLALVGTLSYELSKDNLEKDVIARVSQVSEKLSIPRPDIFEKLENDEEFKNVTIYKNDGEYLTGQYTYDITNIAFKKGPPRKETIGGKDYIVYDIFKPGPPGIDAGLWIRGTESLNSTNIFGRSAFIIILISIPLMLILAALGGYYITKKTFRPIKNISNTANIIYSHGDLKQRIALSDDSTKDELYNLSVTLNTMLDKIENLINQEKQFTSDASHELRTPISVILAQGEYLLDIASTDKEKELAQDIVDKANQVSKLVSELLLLARIDQHRQKIKTEKVDVSLLADLAIDSVKSISFIINIGEDVIVNADEPLLLSAITNLITNAIKYGKESGTVKVSAIKDEHFTKIIVSDDGIGISEDKLGKIWERFYRTDDVRNDEYGSSGLGLSVVKSIVELHGGKVTVNSEYNKGTEFVILLNNN